MIDQNGGKRAAYRYAMATSLGLLGGLATVGSANAQSAFDRSRNVGVLDRPHPGYEAVGARYASFMIFPRLDISTQYDTNVYAAENDATSDGFVSVKPEVSVESTWSRHSLQMSAGANLQRYYDLKTEDTDQYRAAATGRLDISRDSNLTAALNYVHGFEARGSSGYTTGTISPIEYDLGSATLSGVKDFNRVRISGSVGSTNYDYQDSEDVGGVVIDQDYRDNTETTATARSDYAISPATAVFGEVGYTDVSYDGSGSRNSQGVRTLVGANFELTSLMTGEISVGYINRSFDDGITNDVSQFAYRASVNYYPTQLLTVGVKAEKLINDSGIVATPAYVSDTLGFRADYEALRNLIITGVVDISRDTYQNLDRNDNRYGGGLTATYLLNRNAGISLGLSQLTQDSSGTTRNVDFTQRKLSLALVLQF